MQSSKRRAYMAEYNASRKAAQKAQDAARYRLPKNVAKRAANKEKKRTYMREFQRRRRAKLRASMPPARIGRPPVDPVDKRRRRKEYEAAYYSRPDVVARRAKKHKDEYATPQGKRKKRTQSHRYYKGHKDQVLANTGKRRAIERQAPVGDIAIISKWEKSWRSKRSVKCYWCAAVRSPKKCHADHIIALSKNGPHAVENLCISCSRCNHAKHDKTVAAWNQQIAEPVLL